MGVALCAVVCRLQGVKAAFEPVVISLCSAIRSKSLQSQDRAPYLNQLNERLDYNGYINKLRGGFKPFKPIGAC